MSVFATYGKMKSVDFIRRFAAGAAGGGGGARRCRCARRRRSFELVRLSASSPQNRGLAMIEEIHCGWSFTQYLFEIIVVEFFIVFWVNETVRAFDDQPTGFHRHWGQPLFPSISMIDPGGMRSRFVKKSVRILPFFRKRRYLGGFRMSTKPSLRARKFCVDPVALGPRGD